jgi:NaMN:DMB phosphoribosyltransferase
VPVDAAAAADAEARGLGPAAVWLTAVGADPNAARVYEVEAADLGTEPPIRAADPALGPAMSVGETALGVDAGRELAGRARAAGATVILAALDGGERPALIAAALAETGEPRPLRALRRLGDGPIAVLCGAALGAGEHGLGFAATGAAALAGAAVAAGIEPDLRARLIAVGDVADDAARMLVAHLGVLVVGSLDAS